MSATSHEHDTSLSTLQAYLTLALKLAREAGQLIKTAHEQPKTVHTKTSAADCVTQTDRDCESLIISGIKSQYPHHQLIAEESHTTDGEYHPTDQVTWIIDPVDGTNNFIHALPHTCVSIAVMINEIVHVGVIHNPIINETYHAIKGQGAFLNDTIRLQTSSITDITQACVATEWGYDRTDYGVSEMLRKMRNLLALRVQSVRMYGSCAMNMCYVAAGRMEAYYEGKDSLCGPKPWDVAAAGLIVLEAGGVWRDAHGGDYSMYRGRVFVAANATLADIIGEQIAPLKLSQQDDHKEETANKKHKLEQ